MSYCVHIAWHELPDSALEAALVETGASYLAWAAAALEAVGVRCSMVRLGGLSGEVFRFEFGARPGVPSIDPLSGFVLHRGLEALGYRSSILCGVRLQEAIDAAREELSEGRPVLARGLHGDHWGMIVGLYDSADPGRPPSSLTTCLNAAALEESRFFELVTLGPRVSAPHYPHATRAAIARAVRQMAPISNPSGGVFAGLALGENAWESLHAWCEASPASDIASSGLGELARCLARRRCGAAAFLEKTRSEWLVAEAHFTAAGGLFMEVASAMHRVARALATLPPDESKDRVCECVATGQLREHEALTNLRTAAEAIRYL